ncbi:MAG: MCE family protein [Bacteroidaceae bacterium]|nr:MCE family protein [Bacteroidaceae bacterium]
MKTHKKEIVIALTAIAAVALLYFGINFLKGRQLFSDDNTYTILFDDVSGLSASSPVYSNGYKVGMVKEIAYDYASNGKVRCVVSLDRKLQLREGTRAEIASDLLGNVQVNLLFDQSRGQLLPPGATLQGQAHKGALDKAADMLPQVGDMLPTINSILANLETVSANPALQGTLYNAQLLTQRLNNTAQHLTALAATLNHQLPQLVDKAAGTLDNTTRMTSNWADIDLGNTMLQLEQTIGELQRFTQQLNDRTSSLGRLMSDSTLYTNINTAVMHADSLLVNLREHPKRYVHFSVFGRKDK